MTTLAKPNLVTEPTAVRVTTETLSVDVADGRTITVPLQWFPRLMHGTRSERSNYELGFDSIHWPDLNEDISVESLLRGERSMESPKSLKRWLGYRARGEKEPIPQLPLPADISKKLDKIWSAEAKKKPKFRSRRAG